MEFKIANICFEYSSKEYQYLLESTDDVKIGAIYKIPSGVNKYGTMFKYIKVKSIQTVNVLPSIVTSGVKLNSKNYMANTYRIADERLKTLRAAKPIAMPTPTPVVVATPKPVITTQPLSMIEQRTLQKYLKQYCKNHDRMVKFRYGTKRYQRAYKNCVSIGEKIQNIAKQHNITFLKCGKHGEIPVENIR